MFDARAVANKIIEAAGRYGQPLSNLKLQKLLYFVHGRYLIETGKPLVSGEFEAWQYGPVHPLVYSAFKEFGAGDITSPATSIDPVTRLRRTLPVVSDPIVERHVDAVVSSLGRMSAGQLVELTHAVGSPWERTVSEATASANIGLKIRNETIRSHFAKVAVVTSGGLERHSYGDIRENAPYSRD
jgi:uncharacterized phage-associated protein